MKRWQRFVRILLDTNVLISALLSKEGPPGQVLSAIQRGRHILISSHYLAEELRAVANRPHLRSRISHEEVETLIYNLGAVGFVVSELPVVNLSSDPKDNPILATAIVGRADFIVSGDKNHMQNLGEVQGIPILTPRDALERLKNA